MTILLSILCKDGVVIGSDSMSTLGMVGTGVGVPNNKTVVLEDLIVSCAGDDRLMSKFVLFLENNFHHYAEEFKDSSDVYDLPNKISTEFSKYLYAHYEAMPEQIRNMILISIQQAPGFNFSAFIAFSWKGNHYLFSYCTKLLPAIVRDDGIWHQIRGSGSSVASPSIHLVKKLLDINEKPDVNRGSLLCYWTIKHAIEVSSGGIGGNINIKILRKNGGKYQIEEGNIAEHESFLTDFYKHIHSYESISEHTAQRIPQVESSLIGQSKS